MIAYDKASRTQEGFDAFAEEYLTLSHEEYLARIGEEYLASLRVHPGCGYVPGLRRK